MDAFGSLPGQPFRLLLFPCDQFTVRLRWPHNKAEMDDAALLAHAAQHGLLPPAVRVLSKADVNGPKAHPVWTYLKCAYGDTSDIGANFGKFLVARDGRVHGRYCPPLRPALLVRAACLRAYACA